MDITELRFDKKNANKGTPRGRGMLEKSLQKLGCGRSILIDKNNQIIAGNKTTECAGEIGFKKIRVIETDGNELIAVKRMDLDLDTDKKARELAFADNRTSEVSISWNPEEIASAQCDGVAIEDFFTQEEIDKLTGGEIAAGLTDPDECPEAPEVPKTKKGDLWLLGDHRFLCGSGADHDDVIKVMGGDLAQCVFTDPPYGVSIGKKNVMLNSFQPYGRNLTDIVDDDLSPEQLKAQLAPAFAEIKNTVMAEDCTVFVCSPQGGGLGMMMMMMMMQESCHQARHVLIWKKNSPTFSMGRLDYDYQHEPILLTWGKKHKRPMLGTHKTSVWEIDKPRANKEHPTMKPVELYVNAFLNNSDSGDVVYDGYGGSGTCIIAAEQTCRKARVIELSPHYCDVIINRWQKFSGKEAVHENGTKWNDLN